jgi:hypothetical protein
MAVQGRLEVALDVDFRTRTQVVSFCERPWPRDHFIPLRILAPLTRRKLENLSDRVLAIEGTNSTTKWINNTGEGRCSAVRQ